MPPCPASRSRCGARSSRPGRPRKSCPSTTPRRRSGPRSGDLRLMFVSKIKSRPQYQGLKPIPSARRHLIAAEGDGAQALQRLFAEAPPGFAERAEILYASRDGASGGLASLGARSCVTFPSVDDLLQALD